MAEREGFEPSVHLSTHDELATRWFKPAHPPFRWLLCNLKSLNIQYLSSNFDQIMKNKYSIFSLIKNAFSYHENWQRAWRDPEPKKEYDIIIIGGGGHGLATAFYLAKKYNMKNIAVVEKAWIGGGNTGRNTTIIRSNYLWDASAGLYDHALKIWEGFSQELNYNVMFSQRGVMNLAHNLQDVRDLKRRTHANRLNGIDAVWLSNTEEVKKFCPIINISP